MDELEEKTETITELTRARLNGQNNQLTEENDTENEDKNYYELAFTCTGYFISDFCAVCFSLDIFCGENLYYRLENAAVFISCNSFTRIRGLKKKISSFLCAWECDSSLNMTTHKHGDGDCFTLTTHKIPQETSLMPDRMWLN